MTDFPVTPWEVSMALFLFKSKTDENSLASQVTVDKLITGVGLVWPLCDRKKVWEPLDESNQWPPGWSQTALDTITDRLCLSVLIWHCVVHCRRETFSVSSTGSCTAPPPSAVLPYQIYFGVKSSYDLSLYLQPAAALQDIRFGILMCSHFIYSPICIQRLTSNRLLSAECSEKHVFAPSWHHKKSNQRQSLFTNVT